MPKTNDGAIDQVKPAPGTKVDEPTPTPEPVKLLPVDISNLQMPTEEAPMPSMEVILAARETEQARQDAEARQREGQEPKDPKEPKEPKVEDVLKASDVRDEARTRRVPLKKEGGQK